MTFRLSFSLAAVLAVAACSEAKQAAVPGGTTPGETTPGGTSAAAGSAGNNPNVDLALGGGGSSSGAGASGASGTIPAKTCDDSCGDIGQCDDGTCRSQENPGGLSPQQQTALRQGGSGAGSLGWLYPYDKTVFPRGLLPPTLQLDGGAAEAAYVHISVPGFEYEGFFGAADPLRIALPAAVWTTLTSTATGQDSVKVEVSCLRGGVVMGPAAESWTIAPGSMRGSLYYELTSPSSLHPRGIMRLKPGANTADVFAADASSNAVSADGSTLALSLDGALNIYDLRTMAQPRVIQSNGYPTASLYPDGSLAMLITILSPARLIDTVAGNTIPDMGWSSMSSTEVQSAQFSLDGSQIVFAPDASNLALMSFDRATNTFGNRVDLAHNAHPSVIGPAFTPDGLAVVYYGTSNGDDRLDLVRVNIATKQVTRLVAASGASGGQTFANVNPTMLPIAVGGYAWLAFTSDRPYGNMMQGGAAGRFWVAALDLDEPNAPDADPSHPAFYLDGQDADGLNRFAQWALDPCKPNGSACASGDQCCGGYCREVAGIQQCLSEPPQGQTCSDEFEKCAAASDCCDTTARCINSRCARSVVK